MKAIIVFSIFGFLVSCSPGCDSARGRICEKLGIPADSCRSR